MINTAALHVSPIKTCEKWKTRMIVSGWVRGERRYTGVTGSQSCAPKLTSMNVTVGNCSSVALIPVCRGQCASEQRWDRDSNITGSHFRWISHPHGSLWLSRVMFEGILQVEQTHQWCQKRSSERRPLTLQCLDLTNRTYDYEHITGCDCRDCGVSETTAG